MSEAAAVLERLLATMARLRDPLHGCPWDRIQTAPTLARYAIEEAYELADAIERDDVARVRDELGDLLFQVVFHARLAEEQGRVDFAAVARGLTEKLLRRHPHVFDEPGAAISPETLAREWEAHKARERAAQGEQGVLADVPRSLPALSRAVKLGKRAARVGFDWHGAQAVRAKVAEELAELDEALRVEGPGLPEGPAAKAAVREELGDLLFTIANWARHLGVDPEEALRAASTKFERRFERVATGAAAGSRALESLSPGEWDALWEAAKAALDGEAGPAD
jgi:MazG family protein